MRKLNDLHSKYMNDKDFHVVVQSLESIIEAMRLTPEEVREAAMFAAMRVEARYPAVFAMDTAPDGAPILTRHDTRVPRPPKG
jgi:hypothetical protein